MSTVTCTMENGNSARNMEKVPTTENLTTQPLLEYGIAIVKSAKELKLLVQEKCTSESLYKKCDMDMEI